MLLRSGCRTNRERGNPGAKFTDQSIRGFFHAVIIQFAGDIGIKHRCTLVHLEFQKQVQGGACLDQGGRPALFVCKGMSGLGMQVGGALGVVDTLHLGQLCKQGRGLAGFALGDQLVGLAQHLALAWVKRIGLFNRISIGLEHCLFRHVKINFSQLPLNILQYFRM